MSKSYSKNNRNADDQPRDGKRTHRAKSITKARKQQRNLKVRARQGS